MEQILKPYFSKTPCQLSVNLEMLKYFVKCKTIQQASRCLYGVNGIRSDEAADGRLRRVLGDGLAAEGGEDRHGYQTQGGRRTCRLSVDEVSLISLCILFVD